MLWLHHHSGLFEIIENILTVNYSIIEEKEILEILDTGTYSTILKCEQAAPAGQEQLFREIVVI